MFCFISFALAHPFDAELYGHDLKLSIVDQTLSLEYHAEVPFQVVQQELSTLLAKNRQLPLADLRTQYLSSRYESLQQGLSLQIDGELQTWNEVAPFSEKLKKEGQFLIFQLQLSHPIAEGAHQISILNQNYIDQLSIYRSDVVFDDGIWIDKHDVIQPRQWSKEASMQELRLSVRVLPQVWHRAYDFWSQLIGEENRQRISNIPPISLFDRAKRRKLPLEVALGSCLLLGLVAILSPVKRNINSLGVLCIAIGLGLGLEFLGDDRLWVGGLLALFFAIRYRALALFFVLQLVLPWWLVLLFVLPSMRKHNIQKDYIS